MRSKYPVRSSVIRPFWPDGSVLLFCTCQTGKLNSEIAVTNPMARPLSGPSGMRGAALKHRPQFAERNVTAKYQAAAEVALLSRAGGDCRDGLDSEPGV